jgi:hypothetical protein
MAEPVVVHRVSFEEIGHEPLEEAALAAFGQRGVLVFLEQIPDCRFLLAAQNNILPITSKELNLAPKTYAKLALGVKEALIPAFDPSP